MATGQRHVSLFTATKYEISGNDLPAKTYMKEQYNKYSVCLFKTHACRGLFGVGLYCRGRNSPLLYFVAFFFN